MVGTLRFHCYGPGSTPDWEDPVHCVSWQKKKKKKTLFSAVCSCLKMKYSLGAIILKRSNKNVKR